MARKTKAELEAERQEAQATREAHEFAQYPSRLLAALEEATTENNYELEVRNGMFNLRNRNSRNELTLSLTMAHTRDSQDVLESLEWDLEVAASEREESQRRYQVKQAALAKLTAEERELLNL